MRRDVTALKASCVAARSENVDTGRYSTAYAYMRLSKAMTTPRPAQTAAVTAAAGLGSPAVARGVSRSGAASSGEPTECASVNIHALVPPELK